MLAGPDAPSAAFVVEADDVRLEGLAISRFAGAGIVARGARNVGVTDVVLVDNRDYGIQAIDANLAVAGVEVSGSRRAGVSLQRCLDCGVVTGLRASGNFVGFEAVDAASVVLRRSAILANANGVIIQTRDAATSSVAAGADVIDNVVLDNARADVPAPTIFETEQVQPAFGVGIWLGGALDSRVQGNEVRGHRWGIVASVLGRPATGDRVLDNVVATSREADLAWDGVGTGTCFQGNRTDGPAAPTSRPAAIETVYGCTGALPTTVGVPDPTITGDLALASLTTYYCRELELGLC